MKFNYIIDTNILILSLAGNLQELLPIDPMGVSIITEIEILSYPYLTIEEERQLRFILNEFDCVNISTAIKEQTIVLRKKHKIKLPDAIICATALIHQVPLLTNDKQLTNLPELKTRSFIIET